MTSLDVDLIPYNTCGECTIYFQWNTAKSLPLTTCCLRIQHCSTVWHWLLNSLPAVAAGMGEIRLLHSLSLVAVGLSMGYETWLRIGWHHPFMIGWCKYRLGLPHVTMHFGLMEISTVFQGLLTVLLYSPNGRQKPAVRAVQGDCEIV